MNKEVFKIENSKCIKHARKNGTISAILVLVPLSSKLEWIPFDHVDEDSEVWHTGDEGILIISEWIAEKKGWVECAD